MTRSSGNELKVGIFVAAGLAILALFVVLLTGLGISSEEVIYRVYFSDVAGLENGSLVRLGGLKVGRVEFVGISEKNPSLMEAAISVKKGTPIRKNSQAQVTAVGLTGSMYLSLSLGTPDSPLLPSGAEIRGTEASSFQDVINEAKGVAGNLRGVLGGLGETADVISKEAKGLITDIRGNVRQVLATTNRVVQRMENIASAENEKKVISFLNAISKAAVQVEKYMGPAAAEVNKTMQAARGSLSEINKAVQAYASLAGDSTAFVKDARGRLAVVDRLLARLESVGAELEKIIAQGGTLVDKTGASLQAEIANIRKDLQKELRGIGAEAKKQVASLGGEARGSLKQVAGRLNATMGSIQGAAQGIDHLLRDNKTNLKSAITNLASLSGRMDTILAELSGPDSKGLRKAGEELRLALVRAHSLMRQLDEMVSSKREDIQIFISDLRDTASNLNDFTNALRERPATLIFKPPTPPREFR